MEVEDGIVVGNGICGTEDGIEVGEGMEIGEVIDNFNGILGIEVDNAEGIEVGNVKGIEVVKLL